ncbi:unnamed protein product, partial [Closterium sp. Yama58-4]
QVVQLFARVEREIGPIHVLVFNIGANVKFDVVDTTSRVYYKVWEMACLAGFLTSREAAQRMLPRNHGTIIFTGATASVRGAAGFSAFAGAKHALRALAQCLAKELGPQGIHVCHVVIDGAVDTPWARENFPDMVKAKEKVEGLVRPDDVAELYWLLHMQKRSGWTFEVDMRPWKEKCRALRWEDNSDQVSPAAPYYSKQQQQTDSATSQTSWAKDQIQQETSATRYEPPTTPYSLMARRVSPWGLPLALLALFAAQLPRLRAEDDGSSRQYDGKTGAKKLIAEMKKKGYNTAVSLFESTEAMSYYRLTVLAPTDEAFAKLPESVTKRLPGLLRRLKSQAPRERDQGAEQGPWSHRSSPCCHALIPRSPLLAPGNRQGASRSDEVLPPHRLFLAPLAVTAPCSLPGIAKELPEAMSYYRLTVLAPTDEAFAKLPESVTKGLAPLLRRLKSQAPRERDQGAAPSLAFFPTLRIAKELPEAMSYYRLTVLAPTEEADHTHAICAAPPCSFPGIAKELPEALSYYRLTVLAPTDEADHTHAICAAPPCSFPGIAKEPPEALSYYRLTVLAPTDEADHTHAICAAPPCSFPGIAKEPPEALSYYRLTVLAPTDEADHTHAICAAPPCSFPGIAKELPEALSYYRLTVLAPTDEADHTHAICAAPPCSFPGIAKELPEALSYYRLTVLAPTDEAFANLPEIVTKRLSKAASRDITMLHIVKGRKDAATLIRMQREHEWRTPSKNGEAGLFKATEAKVKPVKLHAEGGKNVTITKPDSVLLTISAVHGIDRVIIPGGS